MPIVVNTGKDYLTSLIKLASRPGTEPNYVAMGEGTTAEAATQTALVTPQESRANGTSSQATTTTTNDTFRVVGTITATAGRAITESGLFNASSSGIMVTRAVFSAINLATGDSIQFTWEVRLS